MTAPAAEPGQVGRIALARCAECGTAVTEEDGANLGAEQAGGESGNGAGLARHQTGAYETADPALARAALPILRAFDRQRLRLLGRALRGSPGSRAPGSPSPSRLLDVGAGRGRFVASARAAGYEAEGVEPTGRGVTAARALGVTLRQARLEDTDVVRESLDAVTAWHVIEHLDDPASAVVRMAGWLRPGGVLLIGVPNVDSLQARWGGERWYHLDLPRHRTHFTPAGLRALVAGAGLVPVHVHHLLLEHNPFGMWQSLVNQATTTPSYLYNLLKRNAPLRPADMAVTAAALPLIPVAAALELAAGVLRRGGTIAVCARKPPDHSL